MDRPVSQMRAGTLAMWVAVASLIAVLSATAIVTAQLNSERRRIVHATLTALKVDHSLDEALLALVRLQGIVLDGAEPTEFAAGLDALAALAMPSPGIPQEGAEAIVGAMDRYRQRIAAAVTELRPLTTRLPAAEAVASLRARLAAFGAELGMIKQASHGEVARQTVGMAESDHVPPLLQLLLQVMIGLVLIFVAATVYREMRLRRANAELHAWGRDMTALIGAIPGVLMRCRKQDDGSWQRSFVAPSVLALTGDTPAEASAANWWTDHIDAAALPRLLDAMERALGTAEPSEELQFRRTDGTEIWIRILMRGHGGFDRPREVLSIWTDATQERDMAGRSERLARLAQLGEVATGLAHELNQPLAGITLAAGNALRAIEGRGDIPPRVATKLTLIERLAMRAAGVVDHIRQFGRGAEGPNVPVDIDQVLNEALGLLAERLIDSNVEIVRHLPAGLPLVSGKSVPLQAALINLITNACDAYDAMPEPPRRRLIEVGASAHGDRVRITVRDQAGGVAPDVIGRIFEPFFTTKPPGEGTGLGLSVSYGVLTDMGGTIVAETRDGGTDFAMTLAIAPKIAEATTSAAPATRTIDATPCH